MKAVLTSLSDVAEALRGEYEERGGKFYLKVEGDYAPLVEANARVVEFRDKNIALLKEVDDLRPLKGIAEKFKDIDPDAARVALEKVKALGKKGVDSADDVDNKLKQMLEEAMKPVKEALTAAEAKERAAEARANELTFTTTIGQKAKAAGAQDSAVEYLASLAKDDFEIKDGKVLPKTGKFSKEKPGDPLSVDEWLKDVAVERPFAFAPSTGGGAKPAPATTGGAPTLKTGQTLLKNPTPQQLGENAKAIKAGTVVVEFEEAKAS